MLGIPVWFEVGTFVVLSLLLIVDLLIVTRRPHVPSMREATAWVVFYVVLALVFAALLAYFGGGQAGAEFVTGWLTEYSLSVDNLFVFVIIMTQFAVPREYQQSVLMLGIVMAIVLRGVAILLGALAISTFVWVFYLFGAFLVYTAITLARQQVNGGGHTESYDNAVIRRLRRYLPMTDGYSGMRLWTRENGVTMVTPMLLVFVSIASADVLFAVDSIPAIFGITQETFLVFTANIFALMGLRQLYFLLGGLLERLVYLSIGLAVILGFIGVKLVLHALHENNLPFINGGEPLHWVPEVPIVVSLGVIVGTLVVSAVASLASTRRPRTPASNR